MINHGTLTKWQRFRMFSGATVIALVLARALVRADELVITIYECQPENWHLWVNWFGDYAGYMRWLYCSIYGLP